MIRPLTADDLDDFIAIRTEGFLLAPLSFDRTPAEIDIDREKTRRDLLAKNEENFVLGYFLPAQDSEEAPVLAGIMGFMRYQRVKRSHRGMLWGVYVSAMARGRGAGRGLLAECIRRCRELPGLERVILTASHRSEAALHLYREAGFVEFGREPGAARTGEVRMDEVYLRLEL